MWEQKTKKVEQYLSDNNIKLNTNSAFTPETKFVVQSGSVKLADPCYDVNVWCTGVINQVKNGDWFGKIMMTDDQFFTTVLIHDYIEFQQTTSEIKSELDEIAEELDSLNIKYILSPCKYNKGVIDVIIDEESNVPDELMTKISVNDLKQFSHYGMSVSHERETYGKSLIDNRVSSKTNGLQIAIHADYINDKRFSLEHVVDTFRNATKSDIDVGVDSGQAGMFDEEIHKIYCSNTKSKIHDEFYDVACDCRRGESPIAVEHNGVPFGISSPTAFGDGSYDAYYITDNDEVIAIAIDFYGLLSDEDEEDED